MPEIDVASVSGDYGKFQRNVYLFCLLRGVPNGLHYFIYVFFLPEVDYWCARPDGALRPLGVRSERLPKFSGARVGPGVRPSVDAKPGADGHDERNAHRHAGVVTGRHVGILEGAHSATKTFGDTIALA
ncbi:uncharacterized protein LOC142590220 [Dermacentor variabilis]|uniref:uncharacterized protein LOC142590220 n=1 Tax=Dermacentor variabilis TaxID=34621 RepID=UPI003F5B7A3E